VNRSPASFSVSSWVAIVKVSAVSKPVNTSVPPDGNALPEKSSATGAGVPAANAQVTMMLSPDAMVSPVRVTV